MTIFEFLLQITTEEAEEINTIADSHDINKYIFSIYQLLKKYNVFEDKELIGDFKKCFLLSCLREDYDIEHYRAFSLAFDKCFEKK